MHSHQHHRLLCALILFGAIVLGTGEVGAQPAPVYQFNIPAESLSQALKDFSTTASQQIVFSDQAVGNRRVPPLKGRYTRDEALAILLQGTDLHVEESRSGVLMVRSKNAQAASNEAAQESAGSSETVIVVGSRLPRTAKEGAQEVRTYSKEKIEQSGQGTVADFLNTLPEVSTASIDSPIGSYADQTSVQLHGLPIGTTLVLLNGRRVESNNYGFFDLNNIPVAALERIEVLPVGSSAIYGADSLAGAVNFVLKKDFTGLEVSGRYGFASGIDQYDFSVAGGYAWNRGSVSFVASYQDRGELLGSERAISRDPNNTLAAFGQGDICNPGTVYSLNGGNLPGLSSPVAAIPPGLSGKPSISDFNATAGQVNRCSANRYADLLPPLKREGVLANGEFRLTSWAVLFSEVMVSHEEVNSRVANLITLYGAYGSTLPASNAFNPFGEDVGISYTYSGLPFYYNRTSTFIRPLVGLRGDLGGDWDYELTGFYSYDKSPVHQNDNYDFAAYFGALASSDPATALNVFAKGAPGSPQLLASLFGPPLVLQFNSQNVTAEGIVRGPLVQLDSGPVQTAFGAEYDRSKLYTYQTSGSITSAANVSRRDAYSLFTEVRVPLLANHENPENGETLAISFAGRYDHSDDYGGKSTGQVNAEWRPTDELLFRGGYAMSYQAPLLTQLAGSSGSFTTGGYVDPFRGNEPVNNVVQTFGPNPNLRPQTGDSRQLGFVYSSKLIPGLEVSLTHWDIHITDYIGTPNPQDLIDFPNLFPGAVTRAPPSPEDIQKGYPGQITVIQDVYYNFGKIHVAGFDFDLGYTASTDFGDLTPSLSVTETYKFDSSISPALPPTSSVSRASLSIGFAPRWKAVAALGWKLGPYALHMDGRYIGRYRDYQDFVPNTNELGNFWLFDANARYNIGQDIANNDEWLSGTYVEVGAVNLFDTLPQKSYALSNFDYAEGDIRGRFIYFQIGRAF